MSDLGYWALHDEACAQGEKTYVDPQSGYQVFTRIGLLEREGCCGAGCRHCPFGHEKVRLGDRAERIQQAAWLTDTRPDPSREIVLLFWSGGKDSYLAFRAMKREDRYSIVLLTTFDARSRIIAHQDFSINEVVRHGALLQLPVIGVPLHTGADYLSQIVPGLELVPNCRTLAFGDLHLDYVREWRVETFAANHLTRNLDLLFPIWGADYDTLLSDLMGSDVVCEISAIPDEIPGISVGDVFGPELIAKLPQEVDSFGENGEFHTLIRLR